MALTSPAGAGEAGAAEDETVGEGTVVVGTDTVPAEAADVVVPEAADVVVPEAADVVVPEVADVVAAEAAGRADTEVSVDSGRIVVESETVDVGAVIAPADSEGSGTGHPTSGVVSADDAAVTGTDGVGAGTSTGEETESATTISPMKWLSEAFRTGTGRVVGVVGEGWLPEPAEDGDAAGAGADGAATDAVGGRAGVVVVTTPTPGAAAEEVVVAEPDRPAARVVSVDGAGAATAGGARAGGGRAITGGGAGRWAGTERSELTT